MIEPMTGRRVATSVAVLGVLLMGTAVTPAPAHAALPSDVLTGTVALGTTTQLAGEGDVVVTLEKLDGATPEPLPGVSATTDAQGVYTFTGLQRGDYNLIFEYQGSGPYLSRTMPYSVLFTGSVVDVVLPYAYVVAGRVSLDVSGQYAGEGEVRVTAQNGLRVVSALTDADGRYNLGRLIAISGGWAIKFEYLGPEQYPVWYYTGDSRGAAQTSYRLENTMDRYDHDVVIGVGVSLAGRLVASTGSPVEGLKVTAYGIDPARGYVTKAFTTTTDDIGSGRSRTDGPTGSVGAGHRASTQPATRSTAIFFTKAPASRPRRISG